MSLRILPWCPSSSNMLAQAGAWVSDVDEGWGFGKRGGGEAGLPLMDG